MKKETLEEAAEKQCEIEGWGLYEGLSEQYAIKNAFIEGAKWQQEQILEFLYSEITERRDYSASKMCEKVIDFIEQFKY